MQEITKIGTAIKLILIQIFIFHWSCAYSQNNYTRLNGSDFVKGLENKDYLKGLLLENHFYLTKQGKIGNTVTGHFEHWQSAIYNIDIMTTPGEVNQIDVRIHEAMPGLPQHIMADVKRLFPDKEINKKDDHLAIIDGTLINKETRFNLRYSRPTDNFEVIIWFDYPYYNFRFHENFP